MSLTEFSVDARGVATLTLNRPEIRNAFNAELIREVTQRARDLGPKVRVLVLAGAGKAFCAGADLKWMISMAGYSKQENLDDSTGLDEMFSALDSCSVPVVGRIHGAAIAGATGLVACCDIAVAAESALFAFTEVRIGLVPAVISPYVVRKVGYSFARAAFMTAERFDARRALEVGLVHRVVPDADIDAEIAKVTNELLAAGPEAVIKARELVGQVQGKSPAEVRELTIAMIAERRVSAEGQEGVVAFLEKRPPNWHVPDA